MANEQEFNTAYQELLDKPVVDPVTQKELRTLRIIIKPTELKNVVSALRVALVMPDTSDVQIQAKTNQCRGIKSRLLEHEVNTKIQIGELQEFGDDTDEERKRLEELNELLVAITVLQTFFEQQLTKQGLDLSQAESQPQVSPPEESWEEKAGKKLQATEQLRQQVEADLQQLNTDANTLLTLVNPLVTTNAVALTAQLNGHSNTLQTLETSWNALQAQKASFEQAKGLIGKIRDKAEDELMNTVMASAEQTFGSIEATLSQFDQVQQKLAESADVLWVKRALTDVPEIATAFSDMAPANIPNIPALAPDQKIIQSFTYLNTFSQHLDSARPIVQAQNEHRQALLATELVAQVPSRTGPQNMNMEQWLTEWEDQTVETWEANFEQVYPEFISPGATGTFRELCDKVFIESQNGFSARNNLWLSQTSAQLEALLNHATQSIGSSSTLGVAVPQHIVEKIMNSSTLSAWEQKVKYLQDKMEVLKTGASYRSRIANLEGECSLLIDPKSRPIQLDPVNDIIGNIAKEKLSKIEDIRREIQSARDISDSDRSKLLDALKESEVSVLVTVFKLVLKAVDGTMTYYETNNKPVADFFKNKEKFLSNHASKHAEDAILRLRQMGGYEDLADRLEEKLKQFNAIIEARLMSYATFDTLKPTVIFGKPDSKGVVRSYPGSAEGIYSDNDVIFTILSKTYSTTDEEVSYPNEYEPNPVIGKYRSDLRIRYALDPPLDNRGLETTFMGSSILARSGEWAKLEGEYSLRHFLCMAAVEMFSTTSRFSTNFSNFHIPERYDKVTLEATFLEEAWPAFINEVILPVFVEPSYLQRAYEQTPGIATYSQADLNALRQYLLSSVGFEYEKERVRGLLESVSPAQAKQAIEIVLQTGLPSVLAGSTPKGLSDGVYYTHHLDYLLADIKRSTKRAVPFRPLMMASPAGTRIYEELDIVVEEVKAEYKQKHNKLAAKYFTLTDLPSGGIASQISGVVAKREAELEEKIINELIQGGVSRPDAEAEAAKRARGRYEHLAIGQFCSLDNESRIDDSSPLVEDVVRPDGVSVATRSRFSGRKLNPYFPGFHSPVDSMFIGWRNAAGRLKPRRFVDEVDPVSGEVIKIGGPLKLMDLVDSNGFFHWELFNPEFIAGSLPKYYALYGAKVNAMYSVLASNPGDFSKIHESLSDATNKDALYGAEAFAGDRGRNIRLKRSSAELEKDKFVETMVLADALTMAIENTPISKIIAMIDGTGSLLSPESKEVIRDIVNSSFLIMSMLSDYLDKVSSQVSQAFVYQK